MQHDPDSAPASLTQLAARSAVGGLLMGLANLVPGISGGTMLLASGVYPRFITAVSEVTRLRFRRASLLVLGVVALCAVIAIAMFAGPVKTAVVDYRWVMFSLFIGLTLGGVPMVWRMAKPATSGTWAGVAMGFTLMAAVAGVQAYGGDAVAGYQDSVGMMLLAGVAGASAMILPGISGSYLLLVLGVYVPILTAIDAFKEALKAGDLAAAIDPALSVVAPVGLGVVLGVALVSNLLKVALERYEAPTLGALLGFLLGAVVGLWPFQHGVVPSVGDTIRGRPLTAELLAELDPSKYPTELFSPTAGQAVGALGLIGVGFAITALLARIGGEA